MKLRVGNLWNGALRPRWAKTLTFETTTIVPRAVYMRTIPVKKRPTEIEATVTASGILVPVGTRGRDTAPDAAGRPTAGSPEDRGHLLALSLSGPDDAYNITPQFFSQNRTIRPVQNYPIASLTWREFELYAHYCAQLGSNRVLNPLPPRRTDPVSIDVMGPGGYIVNGVLLIFDEPAEVSRSPAPRFVARWSAKFYWQRGTVAVAVVTLTAEWLDRPPRGENETSTMAARSFLYRVDSMTAEAVARKMENAQQRANRMRRDRRNALINNRNRLRNRAAIPPPYYGFPH